MAWSTVGPSLGGHGEIQRAREESLAGTKGWWRSGSQPLPASPWRSVSDDERIILGRGGVGGDRPSFLDGLPESADVASRSISWGAGKRSFPGTSRWNHLGLISRWECIGSPGSFSLSVLRGTEEVVWSHRFALVRALRGYAVYNTKNTIKTPVGREKTGVARRVRAGFSRCWFEGFCPLSSTPAGLWGKTGIFSPGWMPRRVDSLSSPQNPSERTLGGKRVLRNARTSVMNWEEGMMRICWLSGLRSKSIPARPGGK